MIKIRILANFNLNKLNDFKFAIASNEYRIKEISISGHANYAKKGEDIVCAAVSSNIFGLMNSLDGFEGIQIKIGDNRIDIINDSDSIICLAMIFNCLISLKTIQKRYPTYIKFLERT